MATDDIDDLFRSKLDGHPTPPDEALWARLAATNPAAAPAPTPASQPSNPTAERLDQLFAQGLNTYATPPARKLWERLEDEHLRPRPRRAVVAWWPVALAATVALLLVAGGAGLWLGLPGRNAQSGTVASQAGAGQQQARTARRAVVLAQAAQAAQDSLAVAATVIEAAMLAAGTAPARPNNQPATASSQKQPFYTAQATRPGRLASTASKASMAASGQSLRRPMGTNRQPDAATDHRPLVARTSTHAATQPAPVTAPDEQRLLPTPNPTPLLAVAPTTAPSPEIIHPEPAPTPNLPRATELITVEVRNGAGPARPANGISTNVGLAGATPAEEPRRLGERLLQQAGHLLRGEHISLAEATGLPETVTLQATLAGRSITKSIRL